MLIRLMTIRLMCIYVLYYLIVVSEVIYLLPDAYNILHMLP